jgi:hypothetical protein
LYEKSVFEKAMLSKDIHKRRGVGKQVLNIMENWGGDVSTTIAVTVLQTSQHFNAEIGATKEAAILQTSQAAVVTLQTLPTATIQYPAAPIGLDMSITASSSLQQPNGPIQTGTKNTLENIVAGPMTYISMIRDTASETDFTGVYPVQISETPVNTKSNLTDTGPSSMLAVMLSVISLALILTATVMYYGIRKYGKVNTRDSTENIDDVDDTHKFDDVDDSHKTDDVDDTLYVIDFSKD